MSQSPRYHLCMTHSPLVTRVFQAAMRQQGVPEDSIATFARRGISFSGAGRRVDDLSDGMEKSFRKFDRAGFRAVHGRFEESLRDLTGGQSFEAYVPHANKILYQELINHPDCIRYSYLEEGSTSMNWDTRKNARSSLPKILRTHARSWWLGTSYRFTRPMFDHAPDRYRAAYTISKLAFRGMPGRTDVSAHLPPLPAGTPPGNTYLVLDAVHLLTGLRWEDYEDGLVRALLGTSLPPGEILVKFHFAETGTPEKFESIRRRLAGKGLPPLRMLGTDVPIEERLTGRDLLMFAVTTLGYYSALAGARVACFLGMVKGLSLPALLANGRLPADFAEVVGLEEG